MHDLDLLKRKRIACVIMSTDLELDHVHGFVVEDVEFVEMLPGETQITHSRYTNES